MKKDLFRHFMALISVFLFIPLWPAISQEDVSASENQLTDKDMQKILEKVYDLGMPFVTNQGQVSEEVGFYSKTFGGTVYVTRQGEMVYSLTKKEQDQVFVKENNKKQGPSAYSFVLKERLFQAKKISPVGVQKSATKVNYFVGKNKDKWKANISTFNSLSLGEVYDHIDFALKVHGNNVEKIFTVNPKGKVEDIRVAVEGASSLSVTSEGELEVDTGSGIINFSTPIAFQEINGKRQEVQVTYALKDNTYGFQVGEYNPQYALIIDPSLVYSKILGASDFIYSYGIAVDSSGNAYVTGSTLATDFPTQNPFQQSFGGGEEDAFVTKLTSTGTISYSTYLGGSDDDYGRGIAVDSSGNAYVTGYTYSTDFPTKNAFQESLTSTSTEAFVTKLTSTGSLSYSTYLGGGGYEYGYGIAVDSSGNAYVTGYTRYGGFPTQNAFQPSSGGAFGDRDAFVTKFTSTGSLSYSTYLGGNDDDYGMGIAVDSSGNAYVAGYTYSTDFPTQNPFQPSSGGDRDAFVTKFTSTGSLSYSTYLGGSDDDFGYGIAVDGSGNAYVTGNTQSTDLPTQNAFQPSSGGGFDGYDDAFVTKLTSTGSLSYSTYLGGSDNDSGYGIAVDSSGNAYVTGYIYSIDFPTQNPFQPDPGGGWADYDAFVTKLASNGTLSYSSYLGGSDDDSGHGIAVDSFGNAYVTGHTSSDDFPQQPDDYIITNRSAFITMIGASPSISSNPSSLAFSLQSGDIEYSQTFGVSNAGYGELVYTIDTDSSWITCSPTSGSSTGEEDSIIVNYNALGLSDGVHNATITISAQDADNSPLEIPVTMAIGDRDALYRFLNKTLGSAHFYTINNDEKDNVINSYPDIFEFEGIAYYAYAAGNEPVDASPVYRFWNKTLGSAHFYTISEEEKDFVISTFPDVFQYEGIAYYAYAPGSQPDEAMPVYRFLNKTLGSAHFYTINEAEKDAVIANYPDVFEFEGIAYYAFDTPSSN